MTTLNDMLLQRHQLVRLSRRGWQHLLLTRTDQAELNALWEWARHDWPVIVRRGFPGEQAGVPLGVPLTPSKGKRRLAFVVAAEDIQSTSALPTLTDVVSSAPRLWRPSLQALNDVAMTYAVNAGVFGSLAWQYLTGESYLSSTSDLDVAWSFPSGDQLAHFLDDIADVEACSPMRIDGELLRADGAGVNWRELWGGHRDVAVKTFSAVDLQPISTFLASLP